MHHATATNRMHASETMRSLEASDDGDLEPSRYCPMRMLAAFALLMAGHGRCINTSMMLGDRNYAMWHLARAHTLGDPEVREVAARLFAYFDDEHAPIPDGMRA